MSNAEQHSFQAEIQQLLDIVVHSLYTDKEIFVRELISNAADAMEKVRFNQAGGKAVLDESAELKVSILTDDQARTISFVDTGVGMTHDELVENLGTIARSGSKEFIRQLQESKERSLELIGQFGVGFYSSFMVAERVEVFTRSFDPENEKGWKWSSTGTGNFGIEEAEGLSRGTKIVVHLKEDEADFSKESHIEQIVKKYSSFVPFPIELNGKEVNTVKAIWTRNKSEVTEEEYNEFYHYVGHDPEDPAYRLHFSADAPLSIKALLFVPSRSLERMGFMRHESEVNLHCRKVLIQDKAKGLFPEWLRFLRGVVDSEDMPLNISRETMQDSSLMQKLNKVLTSRFLKMLESELKADPEKYDKFFAEFGHCLKEGVMSDFTHRDALGKILRFESSELEAGKLTTLADYHSRMSEEQKEIYFLYATDRAAAEASPYFEVFQKKGIEVLFLYDHRDEFVMDHLREFEGKKLVAAEKADLKLDNDHADSLSEDDARLLGNWLKELLGERVNEVRASKRLVDSPAVALESDPNMTANMRRILQAMKEAGAGDGAPESKVDLEINPSHPIIKKLNAARTSNGEVAKEVGEQLFDAALTHAGLLHDPRKMLARMNTLIERVLG